MNNATVKKVTGSSPAEKAGIRSLDNIISIDGAVINDVIDYLYLSSCKKLTVEVKRGDRTISFNITKDEDEPLGIGFDREIFDSMKICQNKCPFCFVDQEPGFMRHTLKIKDDDFRLSFLNGNFISLTNLSGNDWKKIKTYRLSPLYVSVHSTNPEVRSKLFGNRKAGNIIENLKTLSEWNIFCHAQIVICPGINDGKELERTLTELSDFYPKVASIAIVPVGVTKYLQPGSGIRKLKLDEMMCLMKTVKKWQGIFRKRFRDPLVFLSDEFYIKTSTEIPCNVDYAGFPQLENGVGMMRRLITEFNRRKRFFKPVSDKKISIITGVLAYPHIKDMIEDLAALTNLEIRLHRVENRFWGQNVDVCGLLTGQDILETLKEEKANKTVLIPSVCLKDDYLFLDDLTLKDIQEALNVNVIPFEPTIDALGKVLLKCK